jgi:hypothetical protein
VSCKAQDSGEKRGANRSCWRALRRDPPVQNAAPALSVSLAPPMHNLRVTACGSSPDDARSKKGFRSMLDLVFIACTLAFFAASVAYTHACERL